MKPELFWFWFALGLLLLEFNEGETEDVLVVAVVVVKLLFELSLSKLVIWGAAGGSGLTNLFKLDDWIEVIRAGLVRAGSFWFSVCFLARRTRWDVLFSEFCLVGWILGYTLFWLSPLGVLEARLIK